MPQDSLPRPDGEIALIALGSNAASRGATPVSLLRRALAALDRAPLRMVRHSALYRTPCFPPGAGPDYVNAAAVVETTLEPQALLALLHRIEAGFGRQRLQRWGDRTLDLDLLALGDLVLPDAPTQDAWRLLPADRQIRHTPDRLILPHPRLQDRGFVLVPLAEVAPDWHHPRTGQTVSGMLDALPAGERAEIRRL